jgi:hypothetical protein
VGLDDIPPSCPVYDTRYVYVYDSTPDVVYVGYLPGYLGCYPSYGTVVYGTGYRYHAYRGAHRYYPRRFTWGFHARYNPWLSRWSFGFSYGSGFLRVGSHWRSAHGGRTGPRSLWFGPGGYRRPVVGKDLAFLRTRPPSTRIRTRVADGVPSNMYHRQENIKRVDVVRVRSVVAPITRPIPTPNDVFAGKDGRVYRREPKGTWQVKTGTGWRPTRLPATPTQVGTSVPPPSFPTGPSSQPRTQRERTDQPTPVQPPAVTRPDRPDQPTPAQPPVVTRPDQPTPRPERRPPPQPERQRPIPRPERERPTPRERPAPQPQRERPAPPPEKPTPGNLEREFHARERVNREEQKPKVEDSGKDRPQKDASKKDDSQKEGPRERSREDARPGRGR